MLTERFIILLTIIAAGAVLYTLWRLWQRVHLRRLATQTLPTPLHDLLGAQMGPAILYFTSADCTQCRYRQTPILAGLAERVGIALHTIDAPSQADLVRHFGIMTVPSTVVLTQDLRPAAINHGLATLPQLQEQLRAL